MKTIRKPVFGLIQVLGLSVLLLAVLALLQAAPSARAQDKKGGDETPAMSFPTTSTCDAYGYCWIFPTTYNWKDLHNPPLVRGSYYMTETHKLEQVVGGNWDDGNTLISLPPGFVFKFYEYTYGQVYLSTNGLLTFGTETTEYINRPIPQDPVPNNYIAPFWDDLTLVDQGAIYYGHGSDAFGEFFAVEWESVPRVGNNELETFEVLLYKNGDIRFQYQSLSGETNLATVGIEDKEGTIGSQIYYNQTGLGNNQAYLIQRPSGYVYRAKVLPEYQSGFVIQAPLSFPFQVRNTGSIGADSYSFTFTGSQPGWTAAVYNPAGSQVLNETGSLPMGVTGFYQVIVTAPAGAAPGETLQSTLVVSSTNGTHVADYLPFQAAVPAPFVQTRSDASSMYLSRTCQLNLGNNYLGSQLTGIGISQTSQKNYFFAHEQNLFKDGKSYTNLLYSLLNPVGIVTKPDTPIQDNFSSATISKTVESRSFAASPGVVGETGIVWVQIEITNNHYLYNVNYAKVNSSGVVGSVVPVTNNSLWRGVHADAPQFSSPQILLNGNRIYLAWVQSVRDGGGDRNELYYAVYPLTGVTPIKAKTLLAGGSPTTRVYGNPSLAARDSGALLVYTISVNGNPVIADTLIGANGFAYYPDTTLSSSGGPGVETDHLSNGNILATWVNAQTNHIAVALFDSQAANVLYGPADLPLAYPFDYRAPSSLAATHDDEGRAILTWKVDTSDFLYYALLDGADAELLTPPMRFTSGVSVSNGSTSKSNAPYDCYLNLFLPLVRR